MQMHWPAVCVLANGVEPIVLPRARLVTIAFAWLTNLSLRWVRDIATKALPMVWVYRRNFAAEMIEKFASVDDSFLTARLLLHMVQQREIPALRDMALSRELPSRSYLLTTSYQPTRAYAITRVASSGLLPVAAFRPRTYRQIALGHLIQGRKVLETVTEDTLDA